MDLLAGPVPAAEAGWSSLDNPTGVAVLNDEVFVGFSVADDAFLAANGVANIPVATAPAAAGVAGISVTMGQTALNTGAAVAGVGMFGWLPGWLHIGDTPAGLAPGPGIGPGWDKLPAYAYTSGMYGKIYSVDSVTVSADRHQVTVVETVTHQPGYQQAAAWKMRFGCAATIDRPANFEVGGDSTSIGWSGALTGTVTSTYDCGPYNVIVGGTVGYSLLNSPPYPSEYHARWLPPYAVGAPTGTPAGTGAYGRSVTCSNGQTYTSSTSATVAQSGDIQLPALNCPAGSVVVTFESIWTPLGGGPQIVTPSTATPAWVRDIPTEYPNCLNETCLLQLFEKTSSTESTTCGPLATLCAEWYISPTRALDYECHWGPYTVALSACAVFRDPGQVLPNAEAGADGTVEITEWPSLELDTGLVATLRSKLIRRYDNDTDTACKALAEAVRADRAATALVTVPDINEVCGNGGGLQPALQWVADSDGVDLAITALVHASTLGKKLDTFTPDCDEINSTGQCLEWASDSSDDLPTPEPEPEPAPAGAGGFVPPPANCLSPTQRDALINQLPIEKHHMATRFALYGQTFQDILDDYNLNLDVVDEAGVWNLVPMAHRGRHPKEYHDWVMTNFENAAIQAGAGNTQAFIDLFTTWVVDTVKADPTIVRLSYWKCYR
ncbi:AHH domain-containing protein [Sanguibacter sp. 25GB23B1]|uniref:AHH domain-containing protein n=1 Tax=unclassified Sanguibacter TaxID=2645534 RepID=UPI0032AEF84C